MKKLFLLSLLVALFACKKSADNGTGRTGSTLFFKDAEQASTMVKKACQRVRPKDNFESIRQISYLQAGKLKYAVIHYTTKTGPQTMVMEASVDEELSVDGGYTVITCDGSECNCYATATFGSNGSVRIGCSCDNCKMSRYPWH